MKTDDKRTTRDMTLREYLAGQVMAGIMARDTAAGYTASSNPALAARVCVMMADALIEELAK